MTDAPRKDGEFIKGRAAKIEYETDELGRKIGVRWLGPLQRTSLSRIVGSEDAENLGVMNNYLPAFAVAEIDGNPVPPPTSRLELDAILAKLDDEGILAAAKAIGRMRGAKTDKEVVDASKNSQATPG